MLTHAFAVSLSLFSYALASTSKVCPILGPSFPKPSNLADSNTFQAATAQLDRQIQKAYTNDTSKYGSSKFKQTTMSIGMFGIGEEGLIWQNHHTAHQVAQSPVGVNHVDANTVYRIGSISKMLTAYLFLALEGDKRWNDPVTDYIPELITGPDPMDSANGILPAWGQITLGDLASQLAGIEADFGLDDIEVYGGYKGLPPFNKSQEPSCNHGGGRKGYVGCTAAEEIAGIKKQPAIFPASSTPSYSNTGYDLFGYALQRITGVPLEQSFNDTLVRGLGLNRTFFSTPVNTSYGAIPISTNRSGWNQDLKFENADGGNFVSTYDFAIIGRSIMKSTLLPWSLTRRWLKPRTFTADPQFFVGAPWEIFRWETPNRLYDMYTKDGGEGGYDSLFVLVPDLGIGFSLLSAAHPDRSEPPTKLSDIIASIMLPAIEDVARQQANAIYAGHYSSNDDESSITVTTDDQPGMRVTEWTSEGKDFLSQLSTNIGGHVDMRLWPNELYNGTQVGFTATWQTLPRNALNSPLSDTCQQWGNVGFFDFYNVGLGNFVFELNSSTGKAISASPKAFRITLKKDD